LTVFVLRRVDVREVVASALVRGLGLNNDVTIRITAVYLCPDDPLCRYATEGGGEGGEERRQRRQRRLGFSNAYRVSREEQPTEQSEGTTEEEEGTREEEESTQLLRRRRVNEKQGTWIDIRFEVVGATTVVDVAKERLRGNVTASSSTMTGSLPWSPRYIAGNL
jgi:hypothetical protein